MEEAGLDSDPLGLESARHLVEQRRLRPQPNGGRRATSWRRSTLVGPTDCGFQARSRQLAESESIRRKGCEILGGGLIEHDVSYQRSSHRSEQNPERPMPSRSHQILNASISPDDRQAIRQAGRCPRHTGLRRSPKRKSATTCSAARLNGASRRRLTSRFIPLSPAGPRRGGRLRARCRRVRWHEQARVVAAGNHPRGHRRGQHERRRLDSGAGGAASDVAETFDDVEDDGYDVTGIVACKS